MSRNSELEKFKNEIYLYENKKLYKIDLLTFSGHTFNEIHQVHHYIKQQNYNRNKKWYDERGIVQKLFLIPVNMHEHIHNQGIKHLTENEFYAQYGVKRSDMLFNRKWSTY